MAGSKSLFSFKSVWKTNTLKKILRILEIQDESHQDLTGSNQHGFKRKRSKSTLSAELLSIIGRALDENECLLMASLDPSSSFDIVSTNLLMKRLIIIGLPPDLLSLMKRCFITGHSMFVRMERILTSIISYSAQYKAQSWDWYFMQYTLPLCLTLGNCGHLLMTRLFRGGAKVY